MGRDKVGNGLQVITSLWAESVKKNWYPKISVAVLRITFVMIEKWNVVNVLIFTHSIGSRSHRKESNDCTKFGLSNFNVLCFVTLLYVFFLVKSDLLSFHGKDTSYMLQHRYDVFRYCVFFLSLLDFSWIFFCSNIVLRGFQTLSVVFTYLDVVNTRHAFLVLQNI